MVCVENLASSLDLSSANESFGEDSQALRNLLGDIKTELKTVGNKFAVLISDLVSKDLDLSEDASADIRSLGCIIQATLVSSKPAASATASKLMLDSAASVRQHMSEFLLEIDLAKRAGFLHQIIVGAAYDYGREGLMEDCRSSVGEDPAVIDAVVAVAGWMASKVLPELTSRLCKFMEDSGPR